MQKMMMLMRKETHPSLGQKLEEDEQQIYNEARIEFLKKLDRTKKGAPFVKEIYRLLDSLTKEYLAQNPVLCHKGCPWCCHQLVCCTTLEMEVIATHIRELPRRFRRDITKKLKAEALKFRELYASLTRSLPTGALTRWEMLHKPLKAAHYGKPCVYLGDDKTCLIYPARPIDCRTAKTRTKGCGPQKDDAALAKAREGMKPVRLFADQVAADLIMEEENRIFEQLSVIPLAAWPLTMRFAETFFGDAISL